MIQRVLFVITVGLCLLVASGCRTTTDVPDGLFDAHHRPDLPRGQWPALPAIIRQTHTWERIPRYLAHLIDTCIRMQGEGGDKLMCITMTYLAPPAPLGGSSGEGVHVYDEIRSATTEESHEPTSILLHPRDEHAACRYVIVRQSRGSN